jgi:uncharacterized protein YprB with RNaseH-like and TPR domain
MTSLAERLRGIVAAVPSGRGVGHSNSPEREPLDAEDSVAGDAAEILDGQWRQSGAHRYLVVDRTYRPGHRHGSLTLLDHLLPGDPEPLRVLLGSASSPIADGSRTLFMDLETTGLAGGAGTCAFLVGCGWFEGCVFRVQQFLLTSHQSERMLLDAVASLAATASLVVSYNGKTFDLPLIETRFLFNRMSMPFAGIAHLDMLHPARRLWRTGERAEESGAATCRLSVLERSVCGHVRDGDVPGFEIPARYFHFVRTGDARPLAAVLEHNRLDLLSLAFLTARAAKLVEDGPVSARTAREAVGLGRLYERAGRTSLARASFARAAGLDETCALPGDEATRADALRGYARLARRTRAHTDAAAAWRQLLRIERCSPHVLREAADALAVHHEHRLRDPRTAREVALESMPLQTTAARRQALQHRLARLDRKVDALYVHARLF